MMFISCVVDQSISFLESKHTHGWAGMHRFRSLNGGEYWHGQH